MKKRKTPELKTHGEISVNFNPDFVMQFSAASLLTFPIVDVKYPHNVEN